MKEYLKDVSLVYEQVQSSEKGLDSSQAAQRLEKNGKNKLKNRKR